MERIINENLNSVYGDNMRIENIKYNREIWLRPDIKNIFPRSMMSVLDDGSVLRGYVDNFEGMKKYIGLYKKDIYSGVFSEWQKNNNIYDSIVFDIDGEGSGKKHNGVDVAYRDFEKVKFLLDLEDIKYRAYCSGRGFAIWVDYSPVCLNDFGNVANNLIDSLGIRNLVDSAVSVDKARVIRVPHTLNKKSNTYAVRINPEDSLEEIKMRSKKNISYYDALIRNDSISLGLKDFDSEYSPESQIKKNGFLIGKDVDFFPDCIKVSMKRIMESGELDNDERLLLGIYLTKVWDSERIMNFFKNTAGDFNSGRTGYNIRYLNQKNYEPYACSRIKNLGLCKYKNGGCPYFPNMGAFL